MLNKLEGKKLLFLYSLLLAILFGTHRVGDFDTWWHLASGRFILATQSIPHADPFSYTAIGAPWVNHEWGAGVLFWLIFKGFDIFGLIFFSVLLFWGGLYFAGRTIQIVNEKTDLPKLSLLFLAWFMDSRVSVRPHLFSFFFLSFLFFVFSLYQSLHRPLPRSIVLRPSSFLPRSLFLIPPLFLVWANLHAESLLALGLMGFFWLGCVIQSRCKSLTMNWHTHLLMIILASAGLMLANPYFEEIYTFPFKHWEMHSIMKHTAEFMPPFVAPWRHLIVFQSYFGVLFIVLFLVANRLCQIQTTRTHFKTLFDGLAGTKPQLQGFEMNSSLLVGAVLAALSLKAGRYTPHFVLWALPLLGTSNLWPRVLIPQSRGWKKITAIFTLILLLFFGFVLLKGNTGSSSLTRSLHRFGVGMGPQGVYTNMIRFLDHFQLLQNQKIFNDMEMGGFLILENIPVFIDGRTPVFGDSFFKEYLDSLSNPQIFEKLHQRWNFSMVLLLREKEEVSANLHEYLFLNPNWALVYLDERAYVYLENNEQNKRVIEKYRAIDSPAMAYLRWKREQPQ